MVGSLDWYSVYGLTANNAYQSSKIQRQDCMMSTNLRKEKVYATLPKSRVPSISLKWAHCSTKLRKSGKNHVLVSEKGREKLLLSKKTLGILGLYKKENTWRVLQLWETKVSGQKKKWLKPGNQAWHIRWAVPCMIGVRAWSALLAISQICFQLGLDSARAELFHRFCS